MQDDKTRRRVQVMLTPSSSCCVSLLCAPPLGVWLRKEGIAWKSHEPTSNSFWIAVPGSEFFYLSLQLWANNCFPSSVDSSTSQGSPGSGYIPGLDLVSCSQCLKKLFEGLKCGVVHGAAAGRVGRQQQRQCE